MVMAPAPEIDRSPSNAGSVFTVIVPETLKAIASAPEPAMHSPGLAPEAVSVLAAAIASRSVHDTSSAAASPSAFTVIDAAAAGAGMNEPRRPTAMARTTTRLVERIKALPLAPLDSAAEAGVRDLCPILGSGVDRVKGACIRRVQTRAGWTRRPLRQTRRLSQEP